MKNKFRRGLLPLCALGAALVLVVSCGTGEGAGYVEWDSSRSPADLDVTISWWNHYSEPDLSSTTEEESRASNSYRSYWWVTDLIAEFNELYPNIKIEMDYIYSYSDIQEKVNQGLSGGNVPNIATCYGDHVVGYYNADATLAMDEFMTDPYIGFGTTVDEEGNIIEDTVNTLEDMNQNYLEAEKGQYASGEYLSLPFSKSSETLAVNLDVFNAVGEGYVSEATIVADGTTENGYLVPYAEDTKQKYEIPTTWSELIELARTIKEDFPATFATQKDGNGLYTAIPLVYDSAENMIISFLEMSGVAYTDGSGETNLDRVLFNNAEAQEIVVQLKSWYDEGLFCTQDQLYYSDETNEYHQYSSTMQTQGTVFMSISSTAGATYFLTDDANFGFYETPTFTLASVGETGQEDTNQHKVITQGPSLTFFDKADVDENYASWLFYKFLTTSENTATLATSSSYFPIRTSSYESEVVTELTTAAEAYNNDYKSYTGTRASAYTGTVLELNNKYTETESYFASDVFTESSDARTAIGDIIQAVFAYEYTSVWDTEAYYSEIASVVATEFNAALASAIGA